MFDFKKLLQKRSFNPGGLIDRPDNRDLDYSEVAASLPPFDWKQGYDVEREIGNAIGSQEFRIPSKHQGPSYSCGGQAFSYYAASKTALIRRTIYAQQSAKYLYSQAYAPGGGSAGRDLCNILIKQGVCREDLLPSYEDGNLPSEDFMRRSQDITASMRQDAKDEGAIAYANVPLSIDVIAQAIAANGGIVLGVAGANNGTWLSSAPMLPEDADPYHWRHWMYFGKALLVDGHKTLEAKNSWGDECGDRGWQMFGEEWFTHTMKKFGAAIWSSWVVAYNPISEPPKALVAAHGFDRDLEFIPLLNGQIADPARHESQKADVIMLQNALKLDGVFHNGIPSTGYYGEITRQAVLKFQLKYSVSTPAELEAVRGLRVGPKTRSTLNKIISK